MVEQTTRYPSKAKADAGAVRKRKKCVVKQSNYMVNKEKRTWIKKNM